MRENSLTRSWEIKFVKKELASHSARTNDELRINSELLIKKNLAMKNEIHSISSRTFLALGKLITANTKVKFMVYILLQVGNKQLCIKLKNYFKQAFIVTSQYLLDNFLFDDNIETFLMRICLYNYIAHYST